MSDSESEYYDDDFQETLYERIVALQDALPIDGVRQIFKVVGSALWVGVTAASITLLPFALEIEKETAAISQESMGGAVKEAIGTAGIEPAK